MQLVVTGASGFVGRRLLSALSGRYEVVCLELDPSALAGVDGVTVVAGDLTDRDWLGRLPARADAIVHLAQAAASFPAGADALFAVNAASTQALASYAVGAGVRRFVLASSGSVYRPQSRPILETDPIDPPGFYAATKAISELILRSYEGEFGVSILRLFAPYGPGQVDRMIPKLVEAVRDGRTITLYNGGEPRLKPIFVSDLVAIIEEALHLEGSQTVNVAGPEVVGVREIAQLAAAALGRKPVFAQETRPGAGDLIADTELMSRLFAPRRLIPPAEGIPAFIRGTDAR
jgi:UDP-glucose 4-epimerase